MEVRVGGVQYSCHAVNSADSSYTLAYGVDPDDGRSRVFRINDGEVTFSVAANRPKAGSVSNGGVFAILDHLQDDSSGTRLRVYRESELTVQRTVESTVPDVIMRSDGSRAVITTRQPDPSVRAYDTRSGELLWTFDPRRETPRLLGFHGSESLLYIAREPRREPYVALDSNGDVVWGNDRYQSKLSLSERLRNWLDRD